MIIAVHQPQYLPWLGYFDKIDRADVFCFLDNVQYKKNEWQNRNRIRTSAGWQWVTVPVHYRFPQRMDEVIISQKTGWQRKHLHALITNYSGAPYFQDYIRFFEEIYARKWHDFCKLNITLIKGLCRMLDIRTRFASASEIPLPDHPTERLIDICRQLGGDTYLSGAGGADYMDVQLFHRSNIGLRFQEFIHPAYPQVFSGFISHLSVVDLLMNCGPGSMEIIRQAQEAKSNA